MQNQEELFVEVVEVVWKDLNHQRLVQPCSSLFGNYLVQVELVQGHFGGCKVCRDWLVVEQMEGEPLHLMVL